MSRNYDRAVDKQNLYAHAHDMPYTNKMELTPPSAKAMRRKQDDNMGHREDDKYGRTDRYVEESTRLRQKQKENGVFREMNQNNICRRQNARTRGFDIHVSNIENINDKISSLLGMIKKDKTHLEKAQKQRNYGKATQSSPGMTLIERIKKQKILTPQDKLSERNEINRSGFRERERDRERQERLNDKQSKSVHKVRAFNALEVVQEQAKEKETSRPQRGKYQYDEQIKRDYSQHKYKRSAQNEVKKSNWKQNMLKQSINIAQYPIINDGGQGSKGYKKAQSRTFQKIDQIVKKDAKIADMSDKYQQKRNQRIRTRNDEHNKFQAALNSQANRDNYETSQMMSKDRSVSRSIYQVLSQQTFQEMFHQQPVRNPSYKDYQPINYNKEENNNRNEKINTTTRIIDDQIAKIRSKIQESQQNNMKLKQKFQQNKEQQFGSNSKKYYDKLNSKSSSPGPNGKHNISQLALRLSDQVQIDLKLKQARQFFEKLGNDGKWDQLKAETDKKGLKISVNHLKQIMKMATDQHNPFGNIRGTEMKLQKIAQILCEAEQHWMNEISRKVPMKSLKEQNVQIRDLDLNSKGYLNIEDIVCFINLYSGQFYRNRDISLVFRRLQLQSGQSGPKISYNNFLKVLTN